MSRPMSMPDFAALLDTSTPLYEARAQNRRQTSPVRGQGHARKKLSISLAAGLMMNHNSPQIPSAHHDLHLELLRNQTKSPEDAAPGSPVKSSLDGTKEEDHVFQPRQDNLFHAYALRSDEPSSPPYTLTFASATVCAQWWGIVQREYPDATRPSPQLFVMKSDDLERVRDNLRFYKLRHKWFYTGHDNLSNTASIIPLQSADGHAIAPARERFPTERPSTASSANLDSLAEKLDRLAGVVANNAEQINALSVAQSAGLQRMQEINEANTAQIKSLAESQSQLQALVDKNASHYIALSNQSFQSQEQIKTIMKTTATQIQNLAKGQSQLANTFDGMMRGIENLATSVQTNMVSDIAIPDSFSPGRGHIGGRLSPAPRKLNRHIKGIWYEYDEPITPASSPRPSVAFSDATTKKALVTPSKKTVVRKKA